VRTNDPEQAPQAVERLEHRGNQGSVAPVTRKNLADSGFEAADVFLGLLAFWIGHVESPGTHDI
jgi:hypothetical protein